MAITQNKLYAVSIPAVEKKPNVTHCIKPGTWGMLLHTKNNTLKKKKIFKYNFMRKN